MSRTNPIIINRQNALLLWLYRYKCCRFIGFRHRLKTFITQRISIRFRWFLRRWKAESETFPTPRKSLKTDHYSLTYERFQFMSKPKKQYFEKCKSAKLQNCKIAKLQNDIRWRRIDIRRIMNVSNWCPKPKIQNVAKIQKCRSAKLQNCRIAELQICKIMKVWIC